MRTQFTECNERKLYVRMSPSTNFMYYVYVLKNKINNELYYGYTNNLERRINKHNKSQQWHLLYYEAYLSKQDARNRELKLKHYGQSRTRLKQRIKQSMAM